MGKRLDRILETPWLLPIVFLGTSSVFVVIDAAYFATQRGASFKAALFSPSEYDLFIRVTVVLLAAIAALTGELILRRYRRVGQALRAEQNRLAAVYDKNPAAVITLDRDMTISYLNSSAQAIVGLPTEDLLGRICHAAIMGEDELCKGCLVPLVFETGKAHSRIKHETTLSGRENWLSQVWYPLIGDDGRVESVVEIASDVSELKLDPLTALPNRLLFRDRLEVALAGARRHGQLLAVLFMDIDGFKGINDSMGHAAGDALLTSFAERLRGIVRQDETMARVSGDEFAMLLPTVEDPREIELMAQRIIDHLRSPFPLDGRMVSVTVSIGAAVYEGREVTPAQLLERADKAMYEVKGRGGNGFQVGL